MLATVKRLRAFGGSYATLLTVAAARCCRESLLFQKGSQMLEIYKVALELARTVAVQGKRIAVHDKDLARQMRRSMASVVLNIAEGAGCDGGTRRQRYKDALGSTRETQAALELGEVLGYGVGIDAAMRAEICHIIGVLVVCTYGKPSSRI